jgi:hypothetical protein
LHQRTARFFAILWSTQNLCILHQNGKNQLWLGFVVLERSAAVMSPFGRHMRFKG